MRRFTVFFIAFFIAFNALPSSLVSAEDFKSVNLLEGGGSYFQNIPVYNQGHLNNCYAYAISAQLDFFRLSHGEKLTSSEDLSSPLWISYDYSRNDLTKSIYRAFSSRPPLDAGWGSSVLSDIAKNGYCTQGQIVRILKSKFPQFFSDYPNLSPEQTYSIIETLLVEYQNLVKDLLRSDTPETIRSEMGASVYLPGATKRPVLVAQAPQSSPAFKPSVPTPKPSQTFDSFRELGDLGRPSALTPASKADNTRNVIFFPDSESQKKLDSNCANCNESFTRLPPHEFLKNFDGLYPADNTQVDHGNSILIMRTEIASQTALEALSQKYAKLLGTQKGDQAIRIKSMMSLINVIKQYKGGLWGLTQDSLSSCRKETKKMAKSKRAGNWLYGMKFSKFSHTLNQILTQKNPQPISILYCDNILKLGKEANVLAENVDCKFHFGLIVGQKLKDGKIKYLIQNSWGPDCSPANYSPKWECLPGQGALWLDGDILLKSAATIDWLED